MKLEELLNNNTIQARDLVGAIHSLQKLSISPMEVLIEHSGLQIEKIARFLCVMLDNSLSFEQTQQQFSILEDQEFENVLRAFKKGNKTIGQHLVDEGLLCKDGVHKIVNKNKDDAKNKELPENSPQSVEEQKAIGYSSAALESIKELVANGALDASALEEFAQEVDGVAEKPQENSLEMIINDLLNVEYDADFFSSLKDVISGNRFKSQLKKLLSLSTETEQSIQVEALKEYRDYLHLLKGNARLSRVQILETTLDKMMIIISDAVEQWYEYDEEKKRVCLLKMASQLKSLLPLIHLILQKSDGKSLLADNNVRSLFTELFIREAA